jgi:Flp pilus assembly protein TadG
MPYSEQGINGLRRLRPLKRRPRGIALIMLTLMMSLVLIPLVGLAIDGGILFMTKAKLQTAVDAAALAGGRSLSVGLNLASQTASCTATVNSYLSANFPNGWFGCSNPNVNVNIAQTAFKTRTVTVTAAVQSPLYFLRVLGVNNATVAAAGQASRRDVNLMLVLDRSESMQVAGVCGTVVNNAVAFVDKFAEGRDRLGLITFMGSPNLDYAPTLNFKTQNPTLEQTIGTMVCGGQTGTEPALWMAYQQIIDINQPGALNVIVLFTDGNPNGYPAAGFTVKRAADTRYSVSNPNNLVATPASSCNAGTVLLPAGFVGEYSLTTPLGNTSGIWSNAGVPLNNPNPVALSSPNCSFNASPYNMLQDVAYLPPTCNHIPSHSISGYLALETYPAGNPYAGKPRVDDQITHHIAGKNITDNVATIIRSDATYTPVIYAIGMGGTIAADPIDDTFMERISNDPRSPIYNSAQQPGVYVYAPNSTQLQDAFNTIASQILRLAQ